MGQDENETCGISTLFKLTIENDNKTNEILQIFKLKMIKTHEISTILSLRIENGNKTTEV